MSTFVISFGAFATLCSPCSISLRLMFYGTDHSGRAVYGMNCLRSLERWERGFECHSKHGCLCVRLFYVCIVLCVGSGLATG
jgi:hypothetical protein